MACGSARGGDLLFAFRRYGTVCIDQDNNEERADQTGPMRRVYATASTRSSTLAQKKYPQRTRPISSYYPNLMPPSLQFQLWMVMSLSLYCKRTCSKSLDFSGTGVFVRSMDPVWEKTLGLELLKGITRKTSILRILTSTK
jgi:hypothetical protein